jgi:hypothetical protein
MPSAGTLGVHRKMDADDMMVSVREVIDQFPEPHRSDIFKLWEDYLDTNPQSPYYVSWTEFSAQSDDANALYTERRVYLKRVKNELRDQEIPLKLWQKVAKGFAAVASVFLIIFLAITRVFRVAD